MFVSQSVNDIFTVAINSQGTRWKLVKSVAQIHVILKKNAGNFWKMKSSKFIKSIEDLLICPMQIFSWIFQKPHENEQ